MYLLAIDADTFEYYPIGDVYIADDSAAQIVGKVILHDRYYFIFVGPYFTNSVEWRST